MKDERNVFERRPREGFGPRQSELPPFARCAKDGAPRVFLVPARSKASATRPLPLITGSLVPHCATIVPFALPLSEM